LTDQTPDESDESVDVGREWPIKGPATARQALIAIGFVFFLGVAIGFLLARTF
jgi:hypothetical protein